MKKVAAYILSIIGWFALILQYYLTIENTTNSFTEANFRFFTYFTILTNLIVTIYFTCLALKNQREEYENSGILTAITVYITVVGFIYQVILRAGFPPTFLQIIANELVHSVIPVFTIIFWYLYGNKKDLHYNMIPKWTIYPICYLLLILIRGHFSGFYPYPFVNVTNLGLSKVLINSLWISIFFIAVSVLYIKIGKVLSKN